MKVKVMWYDYKETIEVGIFDVKDKDEAVKKAYAAGGPPHPNMMIYVEEVPE